MNAEYGSSSEALGTLQAKYDRNARRSRTILIFLGAGGLLAIVAGLVMRGQGISGWFLVLGLGLLLLIFGGRNVYVAIRDRDLQVRVHEEGLVYRRAGEERVIPWSDIASVNHAVIRRRDIDITTRAIHVCTLKIVNGEPLQFSDATLQDVEDLCHTIQAETRSPLLREITARLRAGDTVAFGTLVASREGLNIGMETIPWAHIEDVNTEGGAVALQVNGTWRNVATTGRVDNGHVLSALVDAVHREDLATH